MTDETGLPEGYDMNTLTEEWESVPVSQLRVTNVGLSALRARLTRWLVSLRQSVTRVWRVGPSAEDIARCQREAEAQRKHWGMDDE